MQAARRTKQTDVVMPSAWGKGWSTPVVAYRGTEVWILESPARAANRKRLTRMVRTLRRATRELGITPDQITVEVTAVRRKRARRS